MPESTNGKITVYDDWDGETHWKWCFKWKELETEAEHRAYFLEHGVYWTELAHLPYFDIVCYAIVDAMHNLLLGTVAQKTVQMFACFGKIELVPNMSVIQGPDFFITNNTTY